MSTSTYAEMMGRTASGLLPMHFLGAHAAMQLKGNLLQCNLRQRFVNPHKSNVEIVYTCPLPFGAVLLEVEVKLNSQLLKGSVKPREEAREQYEASIEKGDSAFLVAVNPDGSISMELGNLMPGEACEISLRYAQVLQVTQGALRVMLPTTIAPRYGDAVLDGGFEPHSAPHASLSVEYPFTVDVRIEGELRLARISSPSHPLGMRMSDDMVQLSLATEAWLDCDLVLLLEDLPSGGMAVVARDVLEPDESVVLACLTPAVEQAEAGPACVQVLVDCSGSMGGSSIAAARVALQQVVRQLQPHDLFSLSRFGSRSEHCHRRLVTVTAEQQSLAADWVRELEANLGGTEMEEAILSTVQIARGKASDLLLVTDGDIHAVDSLIAKLRSQSHRCFIVGIGASPAESHLRRMAEATGGACEFVAPGEAVQAAIERMFARLRNVRITQLSLDLPPQVQVMAIESLPRFAFVGDQIQTFIRIQGAWPEGASVALRACVDSGDEMQGKVAPEMLASSVPQSIQSEDNTLARMAAHAVCLQWQRDRVAGDKAGVTELAVRYQLITENTHFVLSHGRDAESAAMQTPGLLSTPNMLAAGHAGAVAAAAPVRGFPMQAASAGFLQRNVSFFGHGDISVPSVWRRSKRKVQKSFKTPQELVTALRGLGSLGHLTSFDQLCKLGLPTEVAEFFNQAPDEAHAVQALVRWLLQCERAQWVIDRTWLAQAQQMGLDDWVMELSADQWPTPLDDLEIPAFLRRQCD